MRSTTDAWTDLNDAVLRVFGDSALDARDVSRALPDIPDGYVRTALHQLADEGFLLVHRGAVHTTYRITEAGVRHLAHAKAMA
jgi:DNA-binding PadR family transcriptional regulator